jgi:enoyl-CoA hydratase/carnithine racemase
MSTSETGLRLDRRDGVAVITIDRADRRNPLGLPGDGDWFAATSAALNADAGVRAVVITGAGTAFSAGGDLKAMRARSGEFAGEPVELVDRYRQGIHRLVLALWSLEVPLIAAVNGPAVGLGNDIACLADLRLAASTATFAATFVRIGLVPGDGGAWLLNRTVGPARAAELLLTGRTLDAETALAWGLVSAVVPAGELLPRALALAGEVAAQPPRALRMTKRLLRVAQSADLPTVLELSAALQAVAHTTADHAEALDAFLARRPPVFPGR